MKIFLTTDDGYRAAGFEKLIRIVHGLKLGKLYALAPSTNMSGCGSSITIRGRMAVTQRADFVRKGVDLCIVSGTPIDCLRLGLEYDRPDLVLVGINNGANVGKDLLLSGTVCAAAYAAMYNIPAIAFSQHRNGELNFRGAISHVSYVIKNYLSAMPPYGGYYPGFFLNVNLPSPGQRYCGDVLAKPGFGGFFRGFKFEDGHIKPKREFASTEKLGALYEPTKYDDDCLARGQMTVTPLRGFSFCGGTGR